VREKVRADSGDVGQLTTDGSFCGETDSVLHESPRRPQAKPRGGRRSRQKGDRAEREIVAKHIEIGVHAERYPLSGASRFRNSGHDLDLYIFGKDEAPDWRHDPRAGFPAPKLINGRLYFPSDARAKSGAG
jgi:hypothetical protein